MMRSPATNDYDREKDVKKFSGDGPDAAMRYLDHDMNGEDFAEAKYGAIGVAIHLGTDPTITAANLNVEATKLHRFINIAEGSKAGDAAWNNADFWTPSYQNAFRLHWKRQLLQWQKHRTRLAATKRGYKTSRPRIFLGSVTLRCVNSGMSTRQNCSLRNNFSWLCVGWWEERSRGVLQPGPVPQLMPPRPNIDGTKTVFRGAVLVLGHFDRALHHRASPTLIKSTGEPF